MCCIGTFTVGASSASLRQALQSFGVPFIPVLLKSKVEDKRKQRRPQGDTFTVYLEIRSFFIWPKTSPYIPSPEKPSKQDDCSICLNVPETKAASVHSAMRDEKQ